jgi:hypothetical protein
LKAAMAKTATRKKTAKHPDLFDRGERLHRVSLNVAGSYFSAISQG